MSGDWCVGHIVEVKIYPNGLYDMNRATEGPVIYALYNMAEKKYYIGKTNNIAMLRWYHHFKSARTKKTKIARAINNSRYRDWLFFIVEIVDPPSFIKSKEELEEFIRYQESLYIFEYDSIENGYNSGYSSKDFTNKINQYSKKDANMFRARIIRNGIMYPICSPD